MTTTRQAVLWGRHHTELQKVAVEEPHPGVAIALTRGWFPKGYAHVDLNEDVAAAVVGPAGTLLVVADGHNGCLASQVAVEVVLDRFAADVPPQGLDGLGWAQLFHAASESVRSATAAFAGPEQQSRTTLSAAVVSGRSIQWASMGDSAVFTVGRRAKQLNRAAGRFVGHPMNLLEVRRELQAGNKTLRREGWVVLATDGVTGFLRPAPPAVAAAAAGTTEAAELARRLVAAAGDAGAGDNVAVAVARVS